MGKNKHLAFHFNNLKLQVNNNNNFSSDANIILQMF